MSIIFCSQGKALSCLCRAKIQSLLARRPGYKFHLHQNFTFSTTISWLLDFTGALLTQCIQLKCYNNCSTNQMVHWSMDIISKTWIINNSKTDVLMFCFLANIHYCSFSLFFCNDLNIDEGCQWRQWWWCFSWVVDLQIDCSTAFTLLSNGITVVEIRIQL